MKNVGKTFDFVLHTKWSARWNACEPPDKKKINHLPPTSTRPPQQAEIINKVTSFQFCTQHFNVSTWETHLFHVPFNRVWITCHAPRMHPLHPRTIKNTSITRRKGHNSKIQLARSAEKSSHLPTSNSSPVKLKQSLLSTEEAAFPSHVSEKMKETPGKDRKSRLKGEGRRFSYRSDGTTID